MKVLDLFSGIGGFSLGLERAGMTTVAFCEIEPFARRVLAKHWPGVPCYDDVRTVSASRLADDGIHVDAICGGFPCQDVSLAGAGAGLDGERSGLWREIARLVGELRPRILLVENVSALLGRGIDRVLGDLAALGYDAEWHCIPASYAGARQLRDRVWIVAYPQRYSVQGGETFTAAWCAKSRTEQPAGLVQPRSWPTVSGARDRGTGHGVPDGTHRNKSIGNAVDPRVVQLIGEAVMASVASDFQRQERSMTARALWNLHDAVMAGECPNDCPDCGADEWSPSAEAYETTGRLVCEHCADAAMERAA